MDTERQMSGVLEEHRGPSPKINLKETANNNNDDDRI